ncbi:MAG: histidine phosphotransferase family protein [Rickettsiaceae bacterium]|nr:histidine phosphotransferase family protein [Rickettsiaceae bacterium]
MQTPQINATSSQVDNILERKLSPKSAPSEIEIAKFVTTKICHDIAGVIGAVNSGVEFIHSKDEQMRSKALELLTSSSSQVVHRLVFLRNAYGVSKYEGEANLEELKKIATEYLLETKSTLDFHEKYFRLPNVFISSEVGSLILSIIHHAHLNLIHGGEIRLRIIRKNNQTHISVTAIGPSPKIDQEKSRILNGDLVNFSINTKNCISFFANMFAKSINVQLTTNIGSKDSVEYEIII